MNIAICRLMSLALGPLLPPLDIIPVVRTIMVIDNDGSHDAVRSFHQDIYVMQSFIVTTWSTPATGLMSSWSVSDENGHHVKVIKATSTTASTEAPASCIVEKIASNEQHPLETSNGRRNRL